MKQEATPPHLGWGIAISLVAYLFFVCASSLVWSFAGQFPTVQVIFIQNFTSLLCIFPLLGVKKFEGLKTKVFSVHLIRDVAGVLSYYLYFVAIRYLNLVDATVLNYTAPFFVPLLWWVWMKERVTRNVWWSIIIGFVGVAIILNPTKQIFQLGFVLGLFAGILSAVSLCAVRVLNLNLEPARRTLFYYFTVGSTLSFPFAWIYWVPPSFEQWIKMISIGLATICGQIFLTIGYRYGTASYLSPLGYASVVYAAISSYAIFDKPITWRTGIGALLIVLGGTASYLLKKKPKSVAQAFESPNTKEKPPL